jgi:hypothetical protein
MKELADSRQGIYVLEKERRVGCHCKNKKWEKEQDGRTSPLLGIKVTDLSPKVQANTTRQSCMIVSFCLL